MVGLCCAACGSRHPGADIIESDSAGIRLATNTISSPRLLARWTLDERPALELGGADGEPEYRFSDIAGSAQLRNGRIVVLDAGRHHLRFFDRDGTFRHSVGALGRRAGEFREPYLVRSQRRDGVLVHDYLLRRFTRVDAAGDITHTVDARFSNARAIAAVDDRVLTFHSLFDVGGEPGVRELPAAFAIFDLGTGAQDTIGRFPGQLYFKAVDVGQPAVILPVPFDVMPTGTAGAETFFITTGELAEIRAYDIDGRLQRIIRLNEAVRAVTRAEFDSAVANDTAASRALYAQLPVPPVRPAFDRIVVDELDWIWVRRYAYRDDGAATWLVFDTQGRARSTIEIPRRFDVHQIGDDYVLGSTRDHDGVEYVRRYALRRGSR